MSYSEHWNAIQKSEILDRAFERLREQTGIEAKLTAPAGSSTTGDSQVVFVQAERKVSYRVAYRAKVDRKAHLNQADEQLRRTAGPGLLVTAYMSTTLATHCREIGLSFLDAAGNAFLHGEGLFVWIAGRKPSTDMSGSRKGAGAFHGRGLQVVFALLAHPPLLHAPYRKVAQAAGASLGTTSKSLEDLMNRNFLVANDSGTRRWVDRQRVLQTWATNFPLGLRSHLQPRRYNAGNADWWREAQPETFDGYWSGEVAAAKLTHDLVPKLVTVYLPHDRGPFLAAHRLKADPRGPIEVLDVFWHFEQGGTEAPGVAPPLLVYADLLDLGDPRTDEQARLIHDRFLA